MHLECFGIPLESVRSCPFWQKTWRAAIFQRSCISGFEIELFMPVRLPYTATSIHERQHGSRKHDSRSAYFIHALPCRQKRKTLFASAGVAHGWVVHLGLWAAVSVHDTHWDRKRRCGMSLGRARTLRRGRAGRDSPSTPVARAIIFRKVPFQLPGTCSGSEKSCEQTVGNRWSSACQSTLCSFSDLRQSRLAVAVLRTTKPWPRGDESAPRILGQ